MATETAEHVCPRMCPRQHKAGDFWPLDKYRDGSGWSCPGLAPDGSDCGYTEPGELDASRRLLELRQQVQQARDTYSDQAADHSELNGHDWQEQRCWGRVEMCDEVLGMLAEGERQEQLAADLGTHADLADPVHGRDVFCRIEASTHE